MGFIGKKYLVWGGLFMGFGLFSGDLLASGESGNEFLDMDISQLLNVTITSVSKKEQRLSDAAAAVFVITQEDIRRSGVTHIAEALAMAPGLQVARISASKWSVSSRGLAGYTSNKLLVLMDGRTVYSPAYSGTFWDMQNTLLEDIDRIEVIRGPGGTLWGANAVNGVINIITKKSSDTLGGIVRAGVGDQETLQGGGRYSGKLNDSTDGRVYLTYNNRDSNTLSDRDGDANDGWQSFQGGFRLDGQRREVVSGLCRGIFTRTDDLFNAFIQDEIKLIEDKLSLTLGTKWEHNDYTGSEWQPSGRLLFKPLDNHSIWASVARAVRTPTIVEHTVESLAAVYRRNSRP